MTARHEIYLEFTVKIPQESSSEDIDPTGWMLWPAARCFADYLSLRPEIVRDKDVLELGSGTGFGGIVSYLLGAKSVILTDLPEGLDRLDESCRCNGLREVEEIQVRSCPWGDMQAVEKLPRQRFDVILCCEVLYKQGEEVYEDLMKTIKATAKPGGIVLVVYEYRGSMLEDQYMFDLLFDEYPDGRMEVLEEGEDDDCERRLLYVFPVPLDSSAAATTTNS